LPALLLVDRVTKRYDRSTGVQDVSFHVDPGEVVGLLGPNGAGKSTTLHSITGILRPDSGSILIDGHPYDDPAAKDVFGFLPDDLPMPESLRAGELMTMHRRLRPSFDENLAHEWLETVGLAAHRSKYFGQYSSGMKRKLQLVLALAHRPRLLVMDEPMRGLDPEAAILVISIMDAFTAANGGVLVSTHDLLAAQRYCTSVVVLAEGIVVADGPPDDLTRSLGATTLEEYFIKVTGLGDAIESKRNTIRSLLGSVASGDRLASSSEVGSGI
jgi:ABC-2 type transport system ATP-binding protein